MSLSVGLGLQAAVGHYSLFMLAQSINSQFVCTIWSHAPNLFYLFHHLDITLVQKVRKEGFQHTEGLHFKPLLLLCLE